MAAMVLRLAPALAVVLPFALSACTPDKKPPPPAAEPVVTQKLGPPKRCELQIDQPGPLRRAGLAQLQLEGSAGKVVARDVPALCGPMFNRTSVSLGVEAGTGVLFEACLPEGLLQVSSFERSAGPQPVRSQTQEVGVDIAFNKFEGGTYSSRGVAADRVVFGPDFWSAEVEVTLKNERDTEELRGTVRFACPTPNPYWESDAGAADAGK